MQQLMGYIKGVFMNSYEQLYKLIGYEQVIIYCL